MCNVNEPIISKWRVLLKHFTISIDVSSINSWFYYRTYFTKQVWREFHIALNIDILFIYCNVALEQWCQKRIPRAKCGPQRHKMQLAYGPKICIGMRLASVEDICGSWVALWVAWLRSTVHNFLYLHLAPHPSPQNSCELRQKGQEINTI